MIKSALPAMTIVLTLLVVSMTTAADISPAQMLTWDSRDFSGATRYSLEQRDNQTLLRAQCINGASALYLEQSIDLQQTPVLRWSWAVANTFANIDETSKAGDDYPVRLYVVKDGGLLPWRTKALNYVWSSTQPAGSDWPNAYTANAHMLALRSGEPPAAGKLVSERRNVREDFQTYHGMDPGSIDGIAIMTDCDNSQQPATGWYGSISWHAEGD
ncbi:DUF3047 domain-containing protein [Halopseudomonas pelagia]|mgnify:CR=1 FL=1|uniref:DUF3047 domain-containing protein n=1 Tax=Halopseudomonas pelagia TaxID=553151 RepID=UPI0003A4ED38|nr:DUF3047 domain-containing protein [Halopseudomonas pelagia]|tara:strand:- start:21669 stop:22313 length:645 start_codon:yes stop_codon:yes gene_type:complete